MIKNSSIKLKQIEPRIPSGLKAKRIAIANFLFGIFILMIIISLLMITINGFGKYWKIFLIVFLVLITGLAIMAFYLAKEREEELKKYERFGEWFKKNKIKWLPALIIWIIVFGVLIILFLRGHNILVDILFYFLDILILYFLYIFYQAFKERT